MVNLLLRRRMMGRNTQESILRSDFSPQYQSWIDTSDIDLNAGDYIEAMLDLSGCQGNNENVLSMGLSIGRWTGNNVHLYYKQSTSILEIDYVQNTYARLTTEKSGLVIIRLDKMGLVIDGERYVSGAAVSHSVMNALLSAQSIMVGSAEGNSRSNAYYHYIKVVHV